MEHNVCNITYHSMDIALHSLRIYDGLYILLYKYCHLHVVDCCYSTKCPSRKAQPEYVWSRMHSGWLQGKIGSSLLVGQWVGPLVCLSCLSIHLPATLQENGWTDFHEIIWICQTWHKERPETFGGLLRLTPWIHYFSLYFAGESVSVSKITEKTDDWIFIQLRLTPWIQGYFIDILYPCLTLHKKRWIDFPVISEYIGHHTKHKARPSRPWLDWFVLLKLGTAAKLLATLRENWFAWNFRDRSTMTQETTRNIFGCRV